MERKIDGARASVERLLAGLSYGRTKVERKIDGARASVERLLDHASRIRGMLAGLSYGRTKVERKIDGNALWSRTCSTVALGKRKRVREPQKGSTAGMRKQ